MLVEGNFLGQLFEHLEVLDFHSFAANLGRVQCSEGQMHPTAHSLLHLGRPTAQWLTVGKKTTINALCISYLAFGRQGQHTKRNPII